MKVTHISVNEHSTLEGVRTVHVAAEFQPGEAIEASDIAAIEGLMMEAAGGKAKAPAEEKPAGRRRGKKAEAEAEAPAEEKPARRRRGKAEAEAPAEEKPARRRRGKAAEEAERRRRAGFSSAGAVARPRKTTGSRTLIL